MLNISNYKVNVMEKPYMALESMAMIRNQAYNKRGRHAKLSFISDIQMNVCEQMILGKVLAFIRQMQLSQGDNGLGRGNQLLMNFKDFMLAEE
jgi:hypothetical protein